MSVRIEVNDAAVIAAFQELLGLVSNPEPILRDFGEQLTNSTDLRWERAVSPDGQPWKPLSPATIKAKKKNADKILIESGNLRELMRVQIQGDTLLFGTDRPYAAIHQFGGKVTRRPVSRLKSFRVDFNSGRSRFAKRSNANFEQWVTFKGGQGTIPARPFLGFSADDRKSFLSILQRHAKKALT